MMVQEDQGIFSGLVYVITPEELIRVRESESHWFTGLPEVEYFKSPRGDRTLPDIPVAILEKLGKGLKPLVLKERIVLKNNAHHPDLSTEESRQILQEALYSPSLVAQPSPRTRPDNFMFVREADARHASSIVELGASEDQYEVVNWHYLNDRTLQQKTRRTEREDGHILIPGSDETHGAVGLSALPPSPNTFHIHYTMFA